jgi:hypothetical protein
MDEKVAVGFVVNSLSNRSMPREVASTFSFVDALDRREVEIIPGGGMLTLTGG